MIDWATLHLTRQVEGLEVLVALHPVVLEEEVFLIFLSKCLVNFLVGRTRVDRAEKELILDMIYLYH